VYRNSCSGEGRRRSVGLIELGERNILHTIKRRKANLIGYILRRNCLLTHVIEGKIEGTRRGGRIRGQLLADRKDRRRCHNLEE